jgi:hypothetical protein
MKIYQYLIPLIFLRINPENSQRTTTGISRGRAPQYCSYLPKRIGVGGAVLALAGMVGMVPTGVGALASASTDGWV